MESWGISRRTALRTRSRPQIPRLSSVVWFATTLAMLILETMFVLITPVTILVLVFLETNPVLTMTLETNPVLTLIDSRNGLCVEGHFQRDDETFLRVRKDEVTFLDVQTDGVTLPVPGSSSRFSLGSVVVLDHVRMYVRT